VFISACNDENTAPPEPVEGEVEVDASSSTEFTYFNLATGQVVTPADPSNSSDWDIAFRRYTVRLNSGTAGTKGVLGYNLENNVSATDAEVLFAGRQLPFFEASMHSDVPPSGDFTGEGLAPDFTMVHANTDGFSSRSPLEGGAQWRWGRSVRRYPVAAIERRPPTVRMTSIARIPAADSRGAGPLQTATLTPGRHGRSQQRRRAGDTDSWRLPGRAGDRPIRSVNAAYRRRSRSMPATFGGVTRPMMLPVWRVMSRLGTHPGLFRGSGRAVPLRPGR
jgi:hypothetical protein